MYPQEKPKLPPKRTVGLKPSPKPAFVVQTEKPDVGAKPSSKSGDDLYMHFHTTAEPLQARVSLLKSQSKKHEPIQHLNDMHYKNNGMKFIPKEYDLHPNEFRTYGMN